MTLPQHWFGCSMRIELETPGFSRKIALTKKQATLVNLIKNHGQIVAREVADIFQLSITNASTLLNSLYKKGYLMRAYNVSETGEERKNEYMYAISPQIDDSPEEGVVGDAIPEEQISRMVDRFLGWKLPEDFSPDCGISFQREFNAEYMASQGKLPMINEPIGTNLLNADQAKAMILHLLGDDA